VKIDNRLCVTQLIDGCDKILECVKVVLLYESLGKLKRAASGSYDSMW
jgi:hypothetical protein